MKQSNVERQQKFRRTARAANRARLELLIPHESLIKLRYLAEHWQCTKTQALTRILVDAWEREGEPIPTKLLRLKKAK